MKNSYKIPEKVLDDIRARTEKCVYCHEKMPDSFIPKRQADCATIEHLSSDPPFYWKDGLKIENIAFCCGSCNSSRSNKKLLDWFKIEGGYCEEHDINENTVAKPVKDFLRRNKGKIV